MCSLSSSSSSLHGCRLCGWSQRGDIIFFCTVLAILQRGLGGGGLRNAWAFCAGGGFVVMCSIQLFLCPRWIILQILIIFHLVKFLKRPNYLFKVPVAIFLLRCHLPVTLPTLSTRQRDCVDTQHYKFRGGGKKRWKRRKTLFFRYKCVWIEIEE